MMLLDALIREFNGHVAFRELRPGVLQVLASDHGLTLMRLNYTYDLDTGNKQRIFNRILSENRIQEQDGRLYIEAEPERLYPALLQFAQTVAKVSSMQSSRRNWPGTTRAGARCRFRITTSTRWITSSISARVRSSCSG
jgi:hypothetical protein